MRTPVILWGLRNNISFYRRTKVVNNDNSSNVYNNKKSYTSTLDVLKKVVEILLGSEIRMNPRVVDDVVAHVDVAELVEGRKPDAVDAKTLDVIQFRLNSWKSKNKFEQFGRSDKFVRSKS